MQAAQKPSPFLLTGTGKQRVVAMHFVGELDQSPGLLPGAMPDQVANGVAQEDRLLTVQGLRPRGKERERG